MRRYKPPSIPWRKLVVGRLWWKLGKDSGVEYLVGSVHCEHVVILRNKNKRVPEDSDFVVLKNTTKEEREKMYAEAVEAEKNRRNNKFQPRWVQPGIRGKQPECRDC